jgi:prephenate dehydratase
MYGLDVLAFPIDEQRVNLTQFFCIGHHQRDAGHCIGDVNAEMGSLSGDAAGSAIDDGKPYETTLAAAVKNQVGSLVEFLLPFQNHGVNLKRIMSRPIPGQPNHYVFFVSAESGEDEPRMVAAMAEARNACEEIRVLGSYPREDPYKS